MVTRVFQLQWLLRVVVFQVVVFQGVVFQLLLQDLRWQNLWMIWGQLGLQ